MQSAPISGEPDFSSKFFEYSLLSQEQVKLRTSTLAGVWLQGPSEQKPFKNLGEKGAWAYPGTAKIFGLPLLSRERVKLRTSNFVCMFLVSIGTKPITTFGKSSRGLVRTLEIFRGTHILGASHGRLYDSSAFLFVLLLMYLVMTMFVMNI